LTWSYTCSTGPLKRGLPQGKPFRLNRLSSSIPLQLHDGYSSTVVPLLAKSIHVDERIIGYLLETDTVDPRISPFCQLLNPNDGLGNIILADEIRHRVNGLVNHFKYDGVVCYLQGRPGVGKQSTAEAVCTELGVPLLVVNINQIKGLDLPLEL